jgi:vancomycin resistance protein YoaR
VNYTQPGKDATVYLSEYRGGKKIDLKLRNDTDGPVYICTEVTRKPGSKNKKQMIARVVIYGKDPGGVTWDIVTEEQEILCVATPVPVMDKPEAAPAENGCIVDSYRVEYTNGVETNRVKLGRDEYKPKPARVYEP